MRANKVVYRELPSSPEVLKSFQAGFSEWKMRSVPRKPFLPYLHNTLALFFCYKVQKKIGKPHKYALIKIQAYHLSVYLYFVTVQTEIFNE